MLVPWPNRLPLRRHRLRGSSPDAYARTVMYHDHEVLTAYDVDGTPLGDVTGLVHGGAQDLLAVRALDGRATLVPFVSALVPEVDVVGGRVVIADRPGLVAPLPDED